MMRFRPLPGTRIALLAAALFALALAGCGAPESPQPTAGEEAPAATEPATGAAQEMADVVYTNGKIYTVDDAKPWTEAVAIKDGKLLVVGSNADVETVSGEGTEVVDLGGHMGSAQSHRSETTP